MSINCTVLPFAREAAALVPSVPVDDEDATSLHRGPLAKAFPVTKFVRLFAVGYRDRADRVMLVRGATAVQAVAIGLVKALHVLFDPVLVVFAHRLASSARSKSNRPNAHVRVLPQHMRLEPRLQKSPLLLGSGSGVVRWSWASPPNSSRCRIGTCSHIWRQKKVPQCSFRGRHAHSADDRCYRDRLSMFAAPENTTERSRADDRANRSNGC